MTDKLISLLAVVSINILILFLVYKIVQPDPKGIIYGNFLIVYGFLAASGGSYLISHKANPMTLVYGVFATANLINHYFVYGWIKYGFPRLDGIWMILSIILIYGAILSVYMLYQIVISKSVESQR